MLISQQLFLTAFITFFGSRMNSPKQNFLMLESQRQLSLQKETYIYGILLLKERFKCTRNKKRIWKLLSKLFSQNRTTVNMM